MSKKSLGSKLHIKPADDVIFSVENEDNVENLYIRAQGPRLINELADTIYHKDAVERYHEHRIGYETFLIDGGSAEVFINGKTAVIEKGDMIQIRPLVGHGFHLLEEGTIWREMFQDLNLYAIEEETDTLRTYSPEYFNDPDFKARRLERAGVSFLEAPVCQPVSKYDIPELRPKGWAINSFTFPDAEFHLKVGRWETDGVKEIWEIAPRNGLRVDWQIPHPDTDLFLVTSGAVRVQADGDHDFVAREHEIINIPPFYKHSITVLEDDTRLLAYNVQSHLLHILQQFKYDGVHDPEKLKDQAYVESVLRGFNCWVTDIS